MSYSISIIKNLWIVLPWWQGNFNERIIYASYLYASLKRQNYFLFMLYEVISTINLDKIQSCQNMIFANFKTLFFWDDILISKIFLTILDVFQTYWFQSKEVCSYFRLNSWISVLENDLLVHATLWLSLKKIRRSNHIKYMSIIL